MSKMLFLVLDVFDLVTGLLSQHHKYFGPPWRVGNMDVLDLGLVLGFRCML